MRNELAQLVQSAKAEWKLKLCVGAALFVAMCTAYYLVGHIPFRSITTLAPTAIDRAVPFSVRWTGVYISLYLLLPFAWLIPTRTMLWRYASGMLLMCAVACTTFVLFPIAGPRPAVAPANALYSFVLMLDNSLNCLPSLHVSLVVYTMGFLMISIMGRLRRPMLLVFCIWSLLIIYSTLATKQHYVVDVVSGALLGWLSFLAVTRARVDRSSWLAPARERAAE